MDYPALRGSKGDIAVDVLLLVDRDTRQNVLRSLRFVHETQPLVVWDDPSEVVVEVR